MLMRSLVLLVLILSTMGEGVQLNNVLQLFYHTCIGIAFWNCSNSMVFFVFHINIISKFASYLSFTLSAFSVMLTA